MEDQAGIAPSKLKPLKPRILEIEVNSPTSEKEWKHWKKTFQNYLAAHREEGSMVDKLQVLTNFLSYTVYEIIDEIDTYDNAIKALDTAFIKTPNEIFARYKLATTKQKSGQTLDEFLQELRRLSKGCNFSAVSQEEHRDGFVRDAFISGIQSHAIRQRLLEESKLSLDSAFNKARVLDIAQQNSASYLPLHDTSSAAVATDDGDSASAAYKSGQSEWTCYFCGSKKKHLRKNCPARRTTCYKCGIRGHYGSVCNQASDNAVATSACAYSLCAIKRAPESLRFAVMDVVLGGKPLSALIDPGSSLSFINMNTARTLKLRIDPSSTTVSMAVGSLKETVTGQCIVELILNGTTYKHVILGVMKNLCSDILLGQDFQRKHKRVVFTYDGNRPDLILPCTLGAPCAVAASFTQCPRLFNNLTPNCRPVATPSRRFSTADYSFIESEVKKLLADGIIRPSSSPWRAQPLVVTNSETAKKRMCIDYSRTINLFTILDAYPLPGIEDIVRKLAEYSVFSTFDLKSAYHQLVLHEKDREPTAFEAAGRLYEFTRLPFGVTNGVPAFQRTIDKIVDSKKLTDTFPYLDNITVGGRTQKEHDKNVKRLLEALRDRNMTLNENKTVSSVSEIGILGYLVGSGVVRPDPERLKPLRELPPPTNKKALQRAMGLFAYYAKWIPNFSDKISGLNSCSEFPLSQEMLEHFNLLKRCVENATLQAIDETKPFVVECDASEIALSATLNQGGRPIAFMSRTLSKSEQHYPAVEKEATAIVEAVRKWYHFLAGRRFTLVTDQKAVSFMFDNRRRTKIKNNKIQCWRLELAPFSYDIRYRPGTQNAAPDALSRVVCSAMTTCNLEKIHQDLCHPGVTRLLHFVRSKNLPFSTDDVKKVCSSCRICAELKPRFYRPEEGRLIKATRPFERLNIDFKGPLPSNSRNKFLLVVVDEYSRFPFCFPCPNMLTSTVIGCLHQLFTLCGTPNYVHSDLGRSFISRELKEYFLHMGVATSHSTPYHPIGNGQVERYNGIIWKAIRLYLKNARLPVECWESALQKALHSIRSMLCTATNATPHELLFAFPRRSPSGTSLPAWLSKPGKIFLKRHVRSSKDDDLVEEVELLDANPMYANVRHKDGREQNVSLSDVAPNPNSYSTDSPSTPTCPSESESDLCVNADQESSISSADDKDMEGTPPTLRHSTRSTRGVPPERYGQSVYY